uniref:Uncharacterized protein n=1 Tax=Avena sativa TaxID=4498 RepID=A0ACD5YHV2_AVESA
MKLIAGTPGTWSGVALRVSQCVFAGASACAMFSAFGNSNYSASFLIVAVLVFTGVSASASVTILFTRDMNFCKVCSRLACGQFKLSIVLAFIVWLLDAASSFSGFWLLISFF